MSGKYLLDSNIVIALFANETSVVSSLAEARQVFIPAPVIGELFYGAKKSGRIEHNTARVDMFVQANVILSCDSMTARWYGDVKNGLRQKGRPIPENDIWIASLALQYQLTLVSRDNHFQEVDSLAVVHW